MTRLDDALLVAAEATALAPGGHALGADPVPGGVRFGVWAPRARAVEVVIEGEPEHAHPLRAGTSGYHSAVVPGAAAGARYRFRLDGTDAYPDPLSRFQPDGPHGPSLVVDPSAFLWSDEAWRGVDPPGQVLYELHVGTFTAAGTFDAAIRELPGLRELGVTLLEVMPVAEFPGRFNWGYDGVALFAPYHGYGDAEAFKRFVDAAHRVGLGVILDVVYNHLGPDGSYLREFSADYFTDRYTNEWGDAINFDGPRAAPVRELVVRTPSTGSREFHLDGLRLDATQSIHDASRPHVVAELAAAARRAALPRSIVLVAENEPQQADALAPASDGGYGLDAMWNDDYHHTARVALTGRRDGYFHDYRGTAQEFVSAARHGFLYQGQHYAWQGKARGTPALALAAAVVRGLHAEPRPDREHAGGRARPPADEPGAPARHDRIDPARAADADALHGRGVRGCAAVPRSSPTTRSACARRCARAGAGSCGSSLITRRRVRRRPSPIRARRQRSAPRSSTLHSASRTRTCTRSTATSCGCGARTR